MAEAKGNSPRVLDVGQCNFDHPRITRFLAEHFGAEVDRAHTKDDALRLVKEARYDLILVNRLLDVDQTPGVEVIRALKEDEAYAEIPVMLVSNYPDAQQEAVEAGAEPGFGKAEFEREETVQRLAAVLR
jgi:CheY-like chemotaxis protein